MRDNIYDIDIAHLDKIEGYKFNTYEEADILRSSVYNWYDIWPVIETAKDTFGEYHCLSLKY